MVLIEYIFMRWKTILCAVLFTVYSQYLYAQIAVIPYKINNSSVNFPETMGGQYSRLLSVAAFIAKEIDEIVSPLDIETDLERMKLNSQEVITRDDLDLLGRTRRIDYFLTGSLAKKANGYQSESVLYSVRDRKIIVRVRVEDADLFKLAEKEVREAFVQYRYRSLPRDSAAMNMDAVFLLDTSYGMNHDWKSVKNAIIEFSSKCIDTLRIDTRIYIVPFSDRHAYSTSSVSINSIPNVRRELENLNPSGGPGSENFIQSLQYAVLNIRWRDDARKMIVIMADSSISAGTADKYAVLARNKGVSIISISLGKIAGDQSEVYDRLATITGSVPVHAAYHQKIYDSKAESQELFLENGRLFTSNFPDSEWRKGLFAEKNKAQGYGKPKSFLEEIFFNDARVPVFPNTMADSYSRITVKRIINKENIDDNIGSLLDRFLDTGGKRKVAAGIIGKALVSDGKVSFWIYSNNKDCMTFLENGQKSGFYVTIGVTVKKDQGAAYGVTLVPLITNLGSSYVPEILKAGLSDIIKQSEYYTTRGLFYPPVWFVSVKIDTTERLHGGKDIRQR